MCVCSYTAEPRSHKHRPLLACGSTDALRGSRSLPRQSRIVRYMIAAQGGIEPESWQRTADYILDTKGATTQGEKVSSYRVTNCGTDDPGDATGAAGPAPAGAGPGEGARRAVLLIEHVQRVRVALGRGLGLFGAPVDHPGNAGGGHPPLALLVQRDHVVPGAALPADQPKCGFSR